MTTICDRLKMGNVLESDASVASDTEIGEIRTDGDGMEMEKNTEFPQATFAQSFLPATAMSSKNKGILPELVPLEPKALDEVKVQPSRDHKSKKSVFRQSPKEFPPMKDLILLKPIRIRESIPEPHQDSSIFTPHILTNKKQREPKFVPYEPYAGAVRAMASQKISSEVPSSKSSVSLDLDDSIGANESPTMRLTKRSPTSPKHSDSSNTTLLKERLRISEKDIQDLRNENIRLKRLFVDSLAGSVELNSRSTTGLEGQQRMRESVDNLSDEIEVWRSKFLSSCVLVEQITKEKEELLASTTAASELFHDIKERMDLTPDLYESIRRWLANEQITRTLTKQNSFSSIDSNDVLW